MIRKVWVILFILWISATAFSHERSWPGRRLFTLWPTAKTFVRVQKRLTSDQINRIESLSHENLQPENKSPTYYYAYADDAKKELLGVVLFIDGYGKNGAMEVSLGFDRQVKLKALDIWQHQERPAIESREFLSYFIGKTANDDLSENALTDSGLPGETVRGVINAVKLGQYITLEAFGQKASEHVQNKVGTANPVEGTK